MYFVTIYYHSSNSYYSCDSGLGNVLVLLCRWQWYGIKILNLSIAKVEFTKRYRRLIYWHPYCYWYFYQDRLIQAGRHSLLKVENISKGSLGLIPSPSPSVKLQIMGGKVCLRCKGYSIPPPSHWRWRWWDRIQAIFLNLFCFNQRIVALFDKRLTDKWP